MNATPFPVLRLVTTADAPPDGIIALMQESVDAGASGYAAALKQALDDFAAYARGVSDVEQGIGLKPGLVPWTTYWLLGEDGKVVAGSRLRHALSPALLEYGGHIGYDVRPSMRRRGYGTAVLALTLERARSLGIRCVLVTCGKDNVASERVILNNGGRFEGESFVARKGIVERRFWIDLG